MIQLDARLTAVANYVPYGEVLADIGTDHGLLPLYLIHNQWIKHAYAMDINELPLQQAERNISFFGFSKKIICILSNGLERLPEDVTVISIAGLGSSTIVQILDQFPEKLNPIKRIILQANVGAMRLREWAVRCGYRLVEEQLVKEANVIYEIIVLEPGSLPLNDDELVYGPILLRHKTELFYEKYIKELHKLEAILHQLPRGHKQSNTIASKIEELKRVLRR